MPDEWLTSSEAAEISGYSVQYVRRLLRQGKVESRKWGAAWQVNRESFSAYLAMVSVSTDRRHGQKHK